MDELFIITEGGQLIYSWHSDGVPSGTSGDDDLIGGFLTAINTFASMERGEDIKSLKLKETTIIFEKTEGISQQLTFVITTKIEDLIELVHDLLHDAMDRFVNMFKEVIERPFDGETSKFKKFDEVSKKLHYSHGFNDFKENIKNIDSNTPLKSIVFLEPRGGHVFHVHAKQYVNKDKISFLMPLIVNSANLLYKNNLAEEIRWLMLTTVRNEILMVEIREHIHLIKQYVLSENIEERFLALDFFKEKDKYVKKPKKIANIFEKLTWDPKVKQVYLVDLLGKIIFSKSIDPSYDCRDYIPETISFLTSSKKASDEIYNRTMLNAAIGGNKQYTTICVNFNNFALVLMGNIKELSDFETIQSICTNIIIQLQ